VRLYSYSIAIITAMILDDDTFTPTNDIEGAQTSGLVVRGTVRLGAR